MRNTLRWESVILAFGLSAVLISISFKFVFAHDQLHRWRLPLVMVMLDQTATYSGAIAHTRSEYDSMSEFIVWLGAQSFFLGNYSNIIYHEADFGNSGWHGLTVTFNNTKLCYKGGAGWGQLTGHCDTESKTADFAKIFFNSNEVYEQVAEERFGLLTWKEYLSTHETHHVMGYTHFACLGPGGDVSVVSEHPVEGRACGSYPYSLATHDTDDLSRDY